MIVWYIVWVVPLPQDASHHHDYCIIFFGAGIPLKKNLRLPRASILGGGVQPNISSSNLLFLSLLPIGSMGLVYLPTFTNKNQPFMGRLSTIHVGKYTNRPMNGWFLLVNVGKYTNRPMDPSWVSNLGRPSFDSRGRLAVVFFIHPQRSEGESSRLDSMKTSRIRWKT